jgi:hypothetical protein
MAVAPFLAAFYKGGKVLYGQASSAAECIAVCLFALLAVLCTNYRGVESLFAS